MFSAVKDFGCSGKLNFKKIKDQLNICLLSSLLNEV
jgi:hypothetical protein